ncbi:MAG: S41 family peptidase [Prevotella sp.]|nr:S41 family peptidase [Prevotella sp.]
MRQIAYLFIFALAATFVSCIDEEEFANTSRGNFEALWKIMDEHYCFFDYKAETLGVDWDEVRGRYEPQVAGATTTQLFEVLTNMLSELRDGHVNLSTSFDYGRNWSWKEDYPTNFSDTLYRKYMGTDYRLVSGIDYRILDDNIGYMRIASFESAIGEGNLDEIFLYFMECRSLIIDIRSNGGGSLTTAKNLAERFTNEKILGGYIQHKTGTGHNDFSPLEAQYLEPSQRMHWQKQVFVLTNRGVYSAANEFVMYMRQCPNVTIVGDKTGGGAGLPFNNELPNGWGVRFSACPTYDAAGNCIEHGIDPDVEVGISDDDALNGLDTIIETARALSD